MSLPAHEAPTGPTLPHTMTDGSAPARFEATNTAHRQSGEAKPADAGAQRLRAPEKPGSALRRSEAANAARRQSGEAKPADAGARRLRA